MIAESARVSYLYVHVAVFAVHGLFSFSLGDGGFELAIQPVGRPPQRVRDHEVDARALFRLEGLERRREPAGGLVVERVPGLRAVDDDGGDGAGAFRPQQAVDALPHDLHRFTHLLHAAQIMDSFTLLSIDVPDELIQSANMDELPGNWADEDAPQELADPMEDRVLGDGYQVEFATSSNFA